jgi:hypothetical protein
VGKEFDVVRSLEEAYEIVKQRKKAWAGSPKAVRNG